MLKATKPVFVFSLFCAAFIAASLLGCGCGDDDDDSGGGDDDAVVATSCMIGGQTYADGAVNPDNSCLMCKPIISSGGWSLVVDETACDDGLYCNGDDACMSGSCVSSGDPCLEDQICNEDTDECDPDADDDADDDDDTIPPGECHIGEDVYNDLDTAPGNVCLICDVTQDQSSWTLNDGATCDDGQFCNGDDTCASGSCSAHVGDPCPDDGLFCNGAESCNETDDRCEDEGDPCGENTFCDEENDFCDPVHEQPDGSKISGAITINGQALDVFYPDEYFWGTLYLWSETRADDYMAIFDYDGSYAFPYVADGTYNLEIIFEYYGDYDVEYTNSFLARDIVMSGADIPLNVDMAFHAVSGVVTDSVGDALDETTLKMIGQSQARAHAGFDCLVEIVMPEDGNAYAAHAPEFGDYTYQWIPKAGLGIAMEWEEDVIVSADLVKNHQFSAATNNVEVLLVSDGGNIRYDWAYWLKMRFIFNDGAHSFERYEEYPDPGSVTMALADGIYDVIIDIEGSDDQSTHYYNPDAAATVSGATDVEFDVPLFTIDGVVTDLGGNAYEDVDVYATHGTFPEDDPGATGWAIYTHTSTDAAGQYELKLPGGDYDIRYEPPYGTTDHVTEIVKDVTVDADATRDYAFQETPIVMSGTVAFNGVSPEAWFGTLIVFGDMALFDEDGVEYFGEVEGGGDYAVSLAPGKTYTASLYISAMIGFVNMTDWYVSGLETDLNPSANFTRDYDLTMVRLYGNVTESDGQTPAAGINITVADEAGMDWFKSEGEDYFVANKLVLFGGAYSMQVPEGTFNLSFMDYNTGYAEFAMNRVVEGDTQLDFVMGR
jgi:hypothetical protein